MSDLHDVEHRIASMGELREVVGAMRALAGMRRQEAEQALPGIRRYAQAMAAALRSAEQLPAAGSASDARSLRQAQRGARALILCTAEHGFVGGFNERLLEAAVGALRAGDVLYVLGTRGAALAAERGRSADWSQPMATRLAAIPPLIQRVTERLFADLGAGRVMNVEVLVANPRTPAQVQCRRLLPLASSDESATLLVAPLHNLPPQSLLEGLVEEYVFALLTEVAVESLAAENAARLSAMEAARDNVSRQLAQLRASAHQLRQAEITAELLDLVTGEQAQRGVQHRARDAGYALE